MSFSVVLPGHYPLGEIVRPLFFRLDYYFVGFAIHFLGFAGASLAFSRKRCIAFSVKSVLGLA